MRSDEWRRFDLYAPRIRSYICPTLPILPSDTLSALHQSILARGGGHFLLPHLQRFHVQFALHRSAQIELARDFLNPHLLSVKLHVSSRRTSHDAALKSFYAALRQPGLELQQLNLNAFGSSGALGELSLLLHSQPTLVDLTLGARCQDSSVFHAISQLPRLLNLALPCWTLFDSSGDEGEEKTILSPRFQSLKTIRSEPGLASKIYYQSATSSPDLHVHASLGAFSWARPDLTSFFAITPHIAQAIKTLKLDVGYFPPTGSLRDQMIPLLGACASNLQALRVEGLVISLELEALLGHTWPSLESLVWRSSLPQRGRFNCGITLCTLARISKGCPKLRDLDIPVNTATPLPCLASFSRLGGLRWMLGRQWLPLRGQKERVVEALQEISPIGVPPEEWLVPSLSMVKMNLGPAERRRLACWKNIIRALGSS